MIRRFCISLKLTRADRKRDFYRSRIEEYKKTTNVLSEFEDLVCDEDDPDDLDSDLAEHKDSIELYEHFVELYTRYIRFLEYKLRSA